MVLPPEVLWLKLRNVITCIVQCNCRTKGLKQKGLKHIFSFFFLVCNLFFLFQNYGKYWMINTLQCHLLKVQLKYFPDPNYPLLLEVYLDTWSYYMYYLKLADVSLVGTHLRKPESRTGCSWRKCLVPYIGSFFLWGSQKSDSFLVLQITQFTLLCWWWEHLIHDQSNTSM